MLERPEFNGYDTVLKYIVETNLEWIKNKTNGQNGMEVNGIITITRLIQNGVWECLERQHLNLTLASLQVFARFVLVKVSDNDVTIDIPLI